MRRVYSLERSRDPDAERYKRAKHSANNDTTTEKETTATLPKTRNTNLKLFQYERKISDFEPPIHYRYAIPLVSHYNLGLVIHLYRTRTVNALVRTRSSLPAQTREHILTPTILGIRLLLRLDIRGNYQLRDVGPTNRRSNPNRGNRLHPRKLVHSLLAQLRNQPLVVIDLDG